MTSHPHRGRGRTLRATASVGLVLALAGVLFTANARLAGHRGERHAENLADLVTVEAESVKELSARVDQARADVERLTDQQIAGTPADAPGTALVELLSGRTAVVGPGLSVRLTDAPADAPRPDGVAPDDLVVHQQDLQAVINALWAGGAEAMAIQDQRVIATTAVRCVGNVLLLHGRVYSPPYVIRAIGDPAALRAALKASPAIARYLEWVDYVGVGWSVSQDDTMTLPAYGGTTELRYAHVPAGVDVFRVDAAAGA